MVVLPEPFGPMSPNTSPRITSKSRSWTARNPPNAIASPDADSSGIDMASGDGCDSCVLFHDDRLHLLEAGALDLVEEDQSAAHVALVVEGDRHAEDALIVARCAHRVAHCR